MTYFFRLFFILLLLTISACNQNKNQYKDESELPLNEVQIGNQVWSSANLNTARFQNGDPIIEARSEAEWRSAGDKELPAWCFYENSSEYGRKYGRLYNWYVVNDKRGLAPKGWHIPSKEEWEKLYTYVGNETEVADKLRSISFTKNKTSQTNQTGFMLYLADTGILKRFFGEKAALRAGGQHHQWIFLMLSWLIWNLAMEIHLLLMIPKHLA